MANLIELQEQLDAIRAVKWSGISEQEHSDGRLKYRSQADMDREIASLEAEILALDSTALPTRRTVRHVIITRNRG